MLALGKDRKAYLLDQNDLGGIGGQLAAEPYPIVRSSPRRPPIPSAMMSSLLFKCRGRIARNPARTVG